MNIELSSQLPRQLPLTLQAEVKKNHIVSNNFYFLKIKYHYILYYFILECICSVYSICFIYFSSICVFIHESHRIPNSNVWNIILPVECTLL